MVGNVAVKWHLPSSSSAEHRGRTDKAKITEHRATWEYVKRMQVKLTIDKNQSLQPCDICFEILQEYHDGGKGGRVHLGNVKINLAEYTNPPDTGVEEALEDSEGMITRRYLMQDSKVNATLKVGISMKQIDGDTNYISPPLKSAMTVGGIAGIIATEAGGETDDMPSIASKSRDLAEAQDIYRRTLAASWACERGELPPDKLVEDLFTGGDGGKFMLPPIMRRMGLDMNMVDFHDSSNSSDAESRRTSLMSLTPETARHGHRRGGSGKEASSSQNSVTSGVSGRGSIEQQMLHSQPSHHSHHHHGHGHRRKGPADYREVTEFDLRDDLRSWQIKAN